MMLLECDKCKKTEEILREWVNKKGRENCHYYPDLFNKLCELYKINRENKELPPEEEFKVYCELYREEIYGD